MDNASANNSALGYLKRHLRSWKDLLCDGDYLQLRCCAHVLNLIVNEGIKEMKDSFEAIRSAVRYIRSSPSHSLRFKTWAEAEKINTKSLVCLDVSTRWNSTYLMLEAAMKFQKVFERMHDEDDDCISYFSSSTSSSRREASSFARREHDGTRCDQDNFSGPVIDDWNNAQIFIKFLKVFYDITLKFSSSLSILANECFHQIARVQKMLQRNITNNANSFLREMSTSMQVKYDKYWDQAENMNPLLFVAVILDPRYKLAYVNHMFDLLYVDAKVSLIMKERVKDCLYRSFNEYSAGVSIDSGTASTSTAGATSLPSFDDDDGGGGEEDPGYKWLESMKQRTSTDPQTELDRYIATDPRDEIPSAAEFDILL
ncbi:zinc finger BED domain-containing protein RICESLEEPER 1-like [Neltuma alba]|uniref:zinc finger BED domain-containing protein RICESLEEPER 1-like n=1 Tax=Neltuma alba TaxID=207710 RepID=UPI0010A2CE6B|nr:zinc finger BED domain-containing protein RICESLEEPER 1-like [Prosopis alba]